LKNSGLQAKAASTIRNLLHQELKKKPALFTPVPFDEQ